MVRWIFEKFIKQRKIEEAVKLGEKEAGRTAILTPTGTSGAEITFIGSGGGGGETTEPSSTQISSVGIPKETQLQSSQISQIQQQGLTSQQRFIIRQRKQPSTLFKQEALQKLQQLKERRKLLRQREEKLISKEKPEEKKKKDKFFELIRQRDIEIEQQRVFEREISFKDLYKKRDLPAIVRKGFRVGGTKFLSFEERILDKKLPKETKIKAGEFIGETVLFVGFLGPIKTTAELEAELAPTGVIFKGIQQESRKGLTKTDIKFITSKGEKGITTGFTKQVGKEGDIIISKTVGVGQTFKQGIQFPTGKVITKPTSSFFGAEKSITKQIKSIVKTKVDDLIVSFEPETTIQFSAGKIAKFKGGKITPPLTKKNIDKFISGSIGFTKGKETLIFGRTITKKTAGTLSLGTIKKISPPTPIYKLSGIKGISKQVSKSALQSLKSITQAGVQQQKTSIITSSVIKSAVPSIPKFKISVQELEKKTEQQLPPKITQIEKQVPKQIVSPVVKITQRQVPKQIPRQKLILSAKLKQENILKTNILSLESQRQQTRLLQRMRLSLKLKQELQLAHAPFISISPVPKPRPRIPIAPFPLLKRGKQVTRKTGSYTALVRRFGKFKPIGRFPSFKQAQEAGRQAAVKTLAATFKIEGKPSKAPRIPIGFRAKPTKKGLLFIELPKFRLSMPTEVKEIQAFRRRKR